jgi:hypothetical protein
MKSTGHVPHMGKKINICRVSVGIAEGWRLLVIVKWIGKIEDGRSWTGFIS